MNYIALNIAFSEDEQAEILTAELADYPFESFETEDGMLKAYIPQERLADCKAGVDALLARYGQPVALYAAGGQELARGRAFLQPILERGEEGLQRLPTPLGKQRRDRFLCLADPALPMEEAGEGHIASMGTEYVFRALQPVYVGERRSHWWGVLQVRDREEESGGQRP